MGSLSFPAPRGDNEAHNDGYRDEHDEPIHEVPISHSRDDSASAKGAAPYLLINPTYGGWYRSPVQTVAGRTARPKANRPSDGRDSGPLRR